MQVITVFSMVWCTQRLVLVCGTTLLDNQLFRSRSFWLRMTSFRSVVKICYADDRLLCVDSITVCETNGKDHRETEKRLHTTFRVGRSVTRNEVYVSKRATKRKTLQRSTCCIRRSSERVALRRIQHDRPLRDDQDSFRIDSRIRICTLFQAVTYNRHRHERPSKLVRRSVPGFHVGRRQRGGRGRDVGHVFQHDVLTVVLPILELPSPVWHPRRHAALARP